jgi:hypothetical protein
MKTLILCAGFVLLLAFDTNAQSAARVYAVTFWDRLFITIDTNSGAGTLITNLPVSPSDLAERGGKLWLFSAGSTAEWLTQVDAWTGAVLGQKPFAGSINGGEGALDFAADGTAIAAKSSEGTGTLFRIDMALTNVVPITADGGLVPSLDGIAFDADGVLYGLNQNNGGLFTLYTVSTNTGATTPVGSLGITFPAIGGAVAGLAFAPDRTLFAALGNPTQSRFYRINKFTGAATLIGSVGFGGVSGFRFFIPPPGPLAISRANEALRLSWPHLRGGVLESANTVTGIWTVLPLPLTTNGTEVFTFTSPDKPERFFRLAQ